MARECGDCLFHGGGYVWNNERCQKLGKDTDFEQPACPYFLDDSNDCCYDCEGRKDTALGGFYCTILKKKIDSPAHWVCPNFR